MQYSNEKRNLPATVWLMILACAVAVIFALCAGGAYAGIREAQLTAARASVGHIEAVLLLAEKNAAEAGMGQPPSSYSNLLKSYDDANSANLPDYEKYVLDRMLDSFGPQRDFDFAISRREDGTGRNVEIYYFPSIGRNDTGRDHYYLYSGGQIVEKNG